MKKVCAFYSTQIPALQTDIDHTFTEMSGSFNIIQATSKLQRTHTLISQRHCKKLVRYGITHHPRPFVIPFPPDALVQSNSTNSQRTSQPDVSSSVVPSTPFTNKYLDESKVSSTTSTTVTPMTPVTTDEAITQELRMSTSSSTSYDEVSPINLEPGGTVRIDSFTNLNYDISTNVHSNSPSQPKHSYRRFKRPSPTSSSTTSSPKSPKTVNLSLKDLQFWPKLKYCL